MDAPPRDADTVLITGSNGFLGVAIAHALCGRYRVIGLDLGSQRQSPAGYDTLEADLSSDASVAIAMTEVRRRTGGRIASVVHLAAYYDVTGEEHALYEQVTVQGTQRLLAQLRSMQCTQFLFSSTLLVHASGEKGRPIDEDWPLAPTWPYPRSKMQAEELIARERGSIKTVTMRFAGVYDEDCHAAFIAQQIARIYEKLPTAWLFAGDITAGQPYLHRDDLVDAVVRAIDRRDALPETVTLLIGEREGPSYGELQKRFGELIHGEDWRTLVLPKRFTQFGAWLQNEVLDEDSFIKSWMIENAEVHYELDTTRAEQLLGWQARHSLGATVPEMIRRLKADPTDWYEKNRLDPATVAASDEELAQARERLRGEQERSPQEVRASLARRLEMTLWAPIVNAGLGLWLLFAPFAFGLFDGGVQSFAPALGYDLPPAAVRDAWLGTSEIVSGVAIVILSLAGLSPGRRGLHWLVAAVGCWVLLAPLVFWTSSPAAYANDTLLGLLVPAFAVIIPSAPGITVRALASDDDRPLGWSFSPSTWTQRLPILALALVGLFVSRYLAAYQMGHIDGVWDPFFGAAALDVSQAHPGARNGSEAVVTSWLSRSFPMPDAGLGAAAYALDVLAGAIGDRRRWRTLPWMVFLFGLLILPLGVVSLVFILIQPPLLGTLCTLCMLQAVVTLILIPYSLDELLATCQYLGRARRADEPFWRTFWRGGPALSENQQPAPDLERPVRTVLLDFLRGGVTYPWTLLVVCAIATALIASPLLFDTAAPLYFSDHVVGWVVLAIAITALAEVARAARLLNVALGLWIAISPFVLEGGGAAAPVANVVAGLAIAALSLPRGKRSKESYGAWNNAIV
ncbi:MAG: NAD-dependent epimerase/dehydratase family protein [Gammaproteobacteria bacterium]